MRGDSPNGGEGTGSQESPKGAARWEACLDPDDSTVASGQPSHTSVRPPEHRHVSDGASLVAQLVQNLPAVQEIWV